MTVIPDSKNQIKLLIVDDEIHIREGLRDCVDWGTLGIDEIKDAEDGKDALLQFATFKPHIVLTDVVMSRMDGIELIKSIRDISTQTRIILMSAYQEMDYIKSAFRYDAIDYLLKPIRTEELHEVVEKAVKSIQIEKLIRAKNDGVEKMDKHETTHEGRRVIEQIRQYIDENYHRHDLSLQDIADHMFLSPNYLSHLYKTQTNLTVHDTLLQKRHEQAKTLLRETNHRIRDIAHSVGYRDANYFAKCFRRIEGCAPHEFRETT